MDGVRFDDIMRALGAAATRRAAMRTLAGSLGLLGLAAGPAEAKKKKKCKKPKVKCGKTCCAAGQQCLAGQCAVPCTFATVGSVMTLQANCTTTTTIDIPDGVTLDGDGKTITLAGAASRTSATTSRRSRGPSGLDRACRGWGRADRWRGNPQSATPRAVTAGSGMS